MNHFTITCDKIPGVVLKATSDKFPGFAEDIYPKPFSVDTVRNYGRKSISIDNPSVRIKKVTGLEGIEHTEMMRSTCHDPSVLAENNTALRQITNEDLQKVWDEWDCVSWIYINNMAHSENDVYNEMCRRKLDTGM